MFLTARLFMYQQVYFHRTVRAIDLDLAEVFGPSIRAIFGDALAGRAARRPTPTSTSTRCSTRPPAGPAASPSPTSPVAGDGTRDARRSPTAGGRSCCASRRWRAEAEVRAEYEAGARPDELIATLGEAEPGRVAIDLAVVDARPADATATDSLLALEGRDGSALSLAAALGAIAGLRADRPPLPAATRG